MGRLGWIALTGAAMVGGVLIHSEEVQMSVGIAEDRFEDKAEILEERIEELGERIERGDVEADEIGDAVEEIVEEVNAEVEAELSEANAAVEETTASIDEDVQQRIDGVTDEIERLREDGHLTQEQYSALVAQLSADAAGEMEADTETVEEVDDPATEAAE